MNPTIFPQPPQGYRPNVGLLLFDMRGLVWIGKRRGFNGQYAWQAPQGGIDRHEDVQAAALRELGEETGIGPSLVSVIGHTNHWLTYDFPAEMQRGKMRLNKGQAQIWYAFRFLGSDRDVKLNAHKHIEFDAWRWERLEALPELVVPFKRHVYSQVAQEFAHLAAA
ncbi:RNA pyrophosphohydrolase [Candidatus Phycosocius spiralis]|uniref:RNA pyrophosphohydrolase n=1 Tax=Candidatus Phycosocius spiralis TaxID=2815099 RepID=A0ABQ4PUZ8_9PROT|nr:RNA pyrophosphohydrolase [Candidatus Phycosocius spiralis]GIU66814.1 RNA pyrophosphohydrolase [Candidatus Phycosocius spiralis]